MITKHLLGFIECYSEQGICYTSKGQEFNIMLMLPLEIGLILLALSLTTIIFLKLGKPSNWFNKQKKEVTKNARR